jgi:hypothetical protein
MRNMTKLFAVGALGAAAFAAVRVRRRAALQQRDLDEVEYELDAYDQYDAPIVVTDEVIIVTEPDEEDFEQSATATEDQSQQQQQPPAEPTLADFRTPGRDAPPR